MLGMILSGSHISDGSDHTTCVHLSGYKLDGITLKHLETISNCSVDDLFKLVEGVWLEGQACETL